MLGDYQQVLALLLVDRELRDTHRREPAALASCLRALGLSLDDDEAASLQALEPDALERCAAGLVAKRRRAVLSALPHTARLWPDLGPRYVELLADQPATRASVNVVLGPGLSELVRLRAPLVHRARLDELAPPWLPALLELELERACARRDGRERLLICDYPVHEVLSALDQGWLSSTVAPARSAYRVGPERLRWRPLEVSP